MDAPLALLFDVDGTLADTEEAHREAFNESFAAEGLSWHWDVEVYTRLLRVSGGKERIAAWWRQLHSGRSPHGDGHGDGERELAVLIDRIHAAKTRRYTDKVGRGQVPLRPGVRRLIEDAGRANIPLAIVTTTTPANIGALLGATLGADWRDRFAAIADAATAPIKKPHPMAYLQVLDALGLPAGSCLAFEDSGNGLAAARAAGVPTVITPTAFTAADDFTGAARVLPDLTRFTLTFTGSPR